MSDRPGTVTPLFMRHHQASDYLMSKPVEGRDYEYDGKAQTAVWKSPEAIPSYAPTANNDQRVSDHRIDQ